MIAYAFAAAGSGCILLSMRASKRAGQELRAVGYAAAALVILFVGIALS